MKKSFHNLWDKMHDPALRLPLMVLVLFLTLVLAGVTLLTRDQAPPASIEAEIILETGQAQPIQTQKEQSPPPQKVTEILPGSAIELPQPAESGEQSLIPAVEGEEKLGWTTLEGKEYYLEAEGKYAVGLRKIGGKLYYFDENGVRAASLGVDVSYYDSSIDW